jgi:hypothetical protein
MKKRRRHYASDEVYPNRSLLFGKDQVKLYNLCPHGFTFITSSATPFKDRHLKEQRIYYNLCGNPARVIFEYEDTKSPIVTGDNYVTGIIPLKRRKFKEVTNLPPPAEENGIPVIYVVSYMVAFHAPRADVYSPGDVDRCAGIIYGTRSLICSLDREE